VHTRSRETRKVFSMGDAISACFAKYATFSGRATRSEFWYFQLFYILLIAVSFIDPSEDGLLGNLVFLGFIIPLTAAGCRRMHDVGKSGWAQIIPFYNLYLLCQDSQGDNQYGARP
jgi:uncharacterized membrane protein YhaH (DUF805 family)